MTMLASFDTDAQFQVATNQGWGDLVRWALTLEPGAYPELQHFAVYGWSQEIAVVTQELTAALAAQIPEDATVAATAYGLLTFLKGPGDATVVVISNGVADDGDEANHAE